MGEFACRCRAAAAGEPMVGACAGGISSSERSIGVDAALAVAGGAGAAVVCGAGAASCADASGVAGAVAAGVGGMAVMEGDAASLLSGGCVAGC
jgi:hypothetical protein